MQGIPSILGGEGAGFTEEWATTSNERVDRRQVEVQANVAGNPNRPSEYRTVAMHQPPTETNQFEAEESKSNRQRKMSNNKNKINKLMCSYHSLYRRHKAWPW